MAGPDDGGSRGRRVPYERKGATLLKEPDDIAAIRAEGRYTILYVDGEKLFCPWSISAAAEHLPDSFVRTHRSYLVNLARISGFERRKDSGVCFVEGMPTPGKVPVSRARLAEVQRAIDL